jgi:hypothetical protein
MTHVMSVKEFTKVGWESGTLINETLLKRLISNQLWY